MSVSLITRNVWRDISRAASASARSAVVAVAYFGNSGSRMLPLRKGSKLVVDASEQAVASGQTCPAELLKLVNRNVRVFSVPRLHAKVFVFGRRAFIGSANVSTRSASQLVEAMVDTSDRKTVSSARGFVESLCTRELTPTVLRRLNRIYKPPKIAGSRKRKNTAKKPSSSLGSRVLLAQLKPEDYTEREDELHNAGLKVAMGRRKHPRIFETDSFKWTGQCPYKRGDKVIQVTKEKSDRMLVDPPGEVLHVRTWQGKRGSVSFVYLEYRAMRRRSLASVARSTGRGSLKLLRRNGLVRNKEFAKALLRAWTK